MKKMQELSPQIKVINEKYEKDPAMKQQKIMELYKRTEQTLWVDVFRCLCKFQSLLLYIPRL